MAEQESKARLYLVIDNVEQSERGKGGERLVEAASLAAALKHVVQPRYTVTIASQRDIARLCGAGTKVEAAGE